MSNQLHVDQELMDEMRGAIFCDPDFVGNFLAAEPARVPVIDRVVEQCPDNFDDILKGSISGEREMYPAVLKVLNTIKIIVDDSRKSHGLGTLGFDFVDRHASSFSSAYPGQDRIKPDLVMFEDATEHWETLIMPIEVKAKATYLKAGLKQLTRYAHMVFAHQIHRRFVCGIVICRWAATFVRFDRSGILHSKPIDMRKDAKEFQRAFGGLMMLDRGGFGYDTAFTVERTPGEQAEYYVDLPADAAPFGDEGSKQMPLTSSNHSGDGVHEISSHQASGIQQLPRRRFKVMERLCHRKCIRGRATIVLRLREVQKRDEGRENWEPGPGPMTRLEEAKRGEPEWEEIPDRPDYVLKLMWRDPHKRPEGEVLKRVTNAYGVVEYLWHSDILKKGASCHKPGVRSCEKCHDATPALVVDQASNLGDLDIELPEEKEGEEPRYTAVETDRYTGKLYARRKTRIYTWVLVRSVGRPLWTARDAREMLEAVRDAILGYWHVVNQGILHRDISEGNVLIRECGGDFDKLTQEERVRDRDQQPPTIPNDRLMKSKKLLQETLKSLCLEPCGFLNDFDLFATHSGMELEFFGELSKRKTEEPDSRTSNAEGAAEMGRPRQSRGSTPPSYGAGKSQERGQPGESDRLPPMASGSMVYAPIDFRTGTPTFMSNRLLAVSLGENYQHHFMDDLQSFFWLILWCAVQHIDSGIDGPGHPTRAAERLLGQLGPADADLDTLGDVKSTKLWNCFTDQIKNVLAACGNSWANDPAIVRVIQDLGTYFYHFSTRIDTEPEVISEYTPDTAFPAVVGIISKALEKHPCLDESSAQV